MKLPTQQGPVVTLVWITLLIAVVVALVLRRWELAFVAAATFGASLIPSALAARIDVRVPMPFLSFMVLFIFATLFLGEALGFYDRYWWWDIALHGSSAIGFGILGFVFVFYLFEGDRFAAPPLALAFLSFCLAVAIGALWEIFEFAMDQTFGMNMQKSGLVDTMTDLIVDVIGGIIGAVSGFAYLKGLERGGLFAWMIAQFVRQNRKLFRRHKG